MKRLVIPQDFVNRVNIHPSLVPSFSGQGMQGMRVHQAVLDYGSQLTGCTVHFDNEHDHGPIISRVPVLPGASAGFSKRVFREEEFVPRSFGGLRKIEFDVKIGSKDFCEGN